jgi:hypothetical protein
MTPQLLERFAALLTTDTDACAGLFTPDAVYLASLGACRLRLVGRAEIRRFLKHVPRQVRFTALPPRREGLDWVGELVVGAQDLAPRTQSVRFQIHDGRFQSFEQLG